MDWLWKVPGEGIEWRYYINPNKADTQYAEKFQGRGFLSADKSTSTVSIEVSNLRTEDISMYFCASDREDVKHKPPCRRHEGRATRAITPEVVVGMGGE